MSTCPTLPPEVWFKILTHLPRSSLHAVSQVSQALHKMATSEPLFQHYHTTHHAPIPQLSTVATWREIHHRTRAIRAIRDAPIYECFQSPMRINPITHIGDALVVHVPAGNTLHALPRTWSLELSFLRGEPRAAAALTDHRCVLVDLTNPEVGNPRLHVVDVVRGSVQSFEIPRHRAALLSGLPGRKSRELLLPAEGFKSVIYNAGVLRVVKLDDMSTRDIADTEVLLLGESPHPVVEGYATQEQYSIGVHSLRGEVLTQLPHLPEGDKLLTLATNTNFTSFTARIQRNQAVVALTRQDGTDWWTHLYNTRSEPTRVDMFYNGARILVLPAHESPRMTVIQTNTGVVGGLHTIRAARVHGAPFDWGALSYGGDVVVLCARRIGIISLFDINTGSCLQSFRFYRGRVDGVALIGGAWIVGWRNRGKCVFEAWRFGRVGKLFGTVDQVLHKLGSASIYDVQSSE